MWPLCYLAIILHFLSLSFTLPLPSSLSPDDLASHFIQKMQIIGRKIPSTATTACIYLPASIHLPSCHYELVILPGKSSTISSTSDLILSPFLKYEQVFLLQFSHLSFSHQFFPFYWITSINIEHAIISPILKQTKLIPSLEFIPLFSFSGHLISVLLQKSSPKEVSVFRLNLLYSHSLLSPLQLGLPLTISLKLFLSSTLISFVLSNVIIPFLSSSFWTYQYLTQFCLPLWNFVWLPECHPHDFFFCSMNCSFLIFDPITQPKSILFNALNFIINYVVCFAADMLFWFYHLICNLIRFYCLSLYQLVNGGASEICCVVKGILRLPGPICTI